jgi:hypothetical protein
VPIEPEEHTCGETHRLLRGSRLITDAESHLSSAGAQTSKEAGRWEEYVTRLSEKYSLASRMMALVAVMERAGDQAGAPPRTQVVSTGLPQDMEFGGIFPAASAAPHFQAAAQASIAADMAMADVDFERPMRWMRELELDMEEATSALNSLKSMRAFKMAYEKYDISTDSEAKPEVSHKKDDFDLLLDLSIRLQNDGGMPGSTMRDRILATLLTLLAFLSHGHDEHHGSFRVHVQRLLKFLEAQDPLPLTGDELIAGKEARAATRAGKPVQGNWLELATHVVSETKGAAERAWDALIASFPSGGGLR